ARKSHPLPSAVYKVRGSGAREILDGEVLDLDRDPVGHIEICERLARAHRIERRAHPQPLYEAVGTRLHECHVTLVVGDVRARGDLGVQLSSDDGGDADAEVLLQAWTDLDAAGIGASFNDGYQLHPHERGLAWMIEALRRRHRVVPVEDLLSGQGVDIASLLRRMRRCRRGWSRHHGLASGADAGAVRPVPEQAESDRSRQSCGKVFLVHGRAPWSESIAAEVVAKVSGGVSRNASCAQSFAAVASSCRPLSCASISAR